ncbi:arsenic efflux protein [Candidatus Bipolaricaulota bacterium]|nr:arsenic efflux protein [Candidatus Bipolaricaulota bacterium]
MNVLGAFRSAITIAIFVFSMMVLVDWLNVFSRGGMTRALRGRKWREYVLASFLGSTPGCLGAFMNVSMYVHGLIGFGALVGGMIATSGDEAYVMFSLFPGKALLVFGGLLIAGVFFGFLSDLIAKRLGIVPCEACELYELHPEELGDNALVLLANNLRRPSAIRVIFFVLMVALLGISVLGLLEPTGWGWMRITLVVLLSLVALLGLSSSEHYLREHIIAHVLFRHTLRVFLWTFGALLIMSLLPSQGLVEEFIRSHMLWVFLFAGLLGLIPESGPHLIFVMMFANGLVPFSVLFLSSFVQDGHGMLPLLSVSVRDSIRVKVFNLVFGFVVGGALYLCGV